MKKRKINLEDILDKYIIVVKGDEKKVVYDVDDSRISITGCGRGARNTVLSENTFKTLKEAEEGIKELSNCLWGYIFKAIKVSELKDISVEGWDILIEDLKDYNWTIDFEKREKEEEQSKLKNRALEIINSEYVYSIDLGEENEIVIRVSNSLGDDIF